MQVHHGRSIHRSSLAPGEAELLADLAEALRRPHDDAAERARRQTAAKRAGSNPRREGVGIHPQATPRV